MVDVNDKLSKGYIQSRAIIEVVGKPKEHVEEALKEYIDKIKNNSEIEVLKYDVSEAKEVEDERVKGLFGLFVEIEILVKDLPTLTGFCFDYMPSSVEIIEPKELKIKENQLSAFINDLQGKLHSLDMLVKQLNQRDGFLKNNINALLRNFISILLMNNSMDVKQLSKFVGYDEKELEKFLEILIKENKIKKEEGKYQLIKNVQRKK